MSAIRPKLVVLGSGFAAFSLLKEVDVKRYAVTLVSPRNHFLFTPLLPSTTVGTIEFRSIIEPIRTARKGIRFHQAWCERVDFEKQQIECRGAFKGSNFFIDYDYLVIGVGGKNRTFEIPGVKEHALFLKELGDARDIRQKVIENFERATKPQRDIEEVKQLLHFVVVGGGPTGVEFAAELHDFVTQDVQKWFPDVMEYVQITLLEATGNILTQFDEKLGNYALKIFKRQHITVKTHSVVTEVDEDAVANGVTLQDGARIPCGLVVWSTGIGPTDLAKSLGTPIGPTNRLLVDEYFRLDGHDKIFAVGDCSEMDGVDLPPTAQVAQQEGKHLAKEFNRMALGQEMRPFKYKHRGMMAYVGSRRALADLGTIQGRGFTTWLLWRSAYLTKLVSFKNKFLVLFDWTRSMIFGRDISRF